MVKRADPKVKPAAAPKKAATKSKKDQEPEGSSRKDLNAMLNGLKYKKG